jgi:hypothetical protein
VTAPVTVVEVRRAAERRRFHELGRVLFAGEPRWAAPVSSYERWLFSRSHPYGGPRTRFLARRGGRVVGRICAHGSGCFGAFDADDDPEAVAALVDAAAATTGPLTFTLGDEAGVLVAGFEHAGGTGRPWHPPYYAAHLRAAGFVEGEREWPRWRVPATATAVTLPPGDRQPPHAGRLGDPRLVLDGVVAVPDVSQAVRMRSVRGARDLLGREAAVVHSDGDPAVLGPAILGAAHAAGYEAVWLPWPDGTRPPDTVHRLLVRG